MYDCIIIGAGPAGMSAAIYLGRKKMKILLLTTDFGGQTAKSAEVENYLGFKKISGPELSVKFQEHIGAIGVESKTTAVELVLQKENIFEVKTADETLAAKSIIVASGKTPRSLNIPGEKKLTGKGISFCATCDGPLFSGKTVAVIGGGNSALDAALELEKYAAKVYILNLNADFQGDEIRKDRVKKSAKIAVLPEVQTIGVYGGSVLNGLKYKNLRTGEEKEIKVEGMFIEVGWVPATNFVKDLVELNHLGEIKIDKENQTSCPGIFAAGDVTDIRDKQIIIAAGDGAKAALSAWRYVIMHKQIE